MQNSLRNFLPIIGLVVLLLVVFWPVLTGGVFLNTGVVYSDLWLFNYPLKDWYREALVAGRMPFWTNLIGNGYPMFAEMQVGALYPAHYLLFRFLPMPLAFNLNIVLHFLLAAVFTYAFSRVSLKLSRWAAALVSLVYVLSGYFMTHLHQINILEVAAYFPLVLLVTERLVTTRRFYWVFLGALVFSLQILAGYVELFYYTVVLAAAFFVCMAFFFREREAVVPIGPATIAGFLLMAVLGVGMSAAQLLPTWELTELSQRAEGLSLETASATVWPLEKLILFVNPGAYDMYEPEPGYHPLVSTTVNIPALYGYVGLLPLVFAVLALARVRRRFVTIFSLLLVGAFIYGLGRSTQFFAILWEVVPGLKFFRYPVKILFFIELALGIIAGFGFDWLRERFAPAKGTVSGVKYVLGAAILAILFLDLYFNNFRRVLMVVSAEEWFAGHEAVAFLQKEIDPLRYRMYSHGTNNLDYATVRTLERQKDYQNILPVDYNMLFALPSNREWVALFLDRQQTINRIRTTLNPETGVLEIPQELKRSLDLQSVKFLVADLPIEDPDLTPVSKIPFSQTVDHLAYFGGGGEVRTVRVPARATYIYENRGAVPRATFVTSGRIVSSEESLTAVLDPEFDPLKEVVLEGAVGNVARADGGAGTATIMSDTEEEVTLTVRADTDGYLVLADTYYPGWTATVDGKPVEILQANYAFRAVPVGEGEHSVRFSFEPTNWRLGLLISGISLLVTIVGLGYTAMSKK